MVSYENTGASLNFKSGYTSFNMEVMRAIGYSKNEYIVIINQTTKLDDLEGFEGCEDFSVSFKCVCLNSPTEHSALHFAGKKYIKNWDTRHRIGKDFPLKS